ncbi:MAG: hypothetical protein KF734_19095 [Saprospiraceae bacterium]|nr:hypothetical protein [Saprospiraceae bacterium]
MTDFIFSPLQDGRQKIASKTYIFDGKAPEFTTLYNVSDICIIIELVKSRVKDKVK